MRARSLLQGLVTGAIAGLLYRTIVRPRHLHTGATREEVRRAMPGDDLVPAPMLEATHAITISASPPQIWPWLVQMGYGRAGWYSEEGSDDEAASVDRIIPEFQYLEPMDILATDGLGGFRVISLELERSLVLLRECIHSRISATLLLLPIADGKTRLVLRQRACFGQPVHRLVARVSDPEDFVIMRRMLTGIKARAERYAEHEPDHRDDRKRSASRAATMRRGSGFGGEAGYAPRGGVTVSHEGGRR